MADLSITAANVAAYSDYTINKNFNAGATVTAGQLVYLDETTATWKLADNNGTAAVAVIGGVALNGAASGQPLAVQTSGTIAIGATVTVGEIYVLSDTAGGIKPEGDLASTQYVSVAGIGVTTARIKLGIVNSGVQIP